MGRIGGYGGYGCVGGYGGYGRYGMSPIGNYGYRNGYGFGPYRSGYGLGYTRDNYPTGESYGYGNELGASREYSESRGVGYYSPTMGRIPGRFGDDYSTQIQGGSLRTWTYKSAAIEQVQVVLTTEGR